MDISVIIPTLNRKEILKKCLQYLFGQTYPKDKFEIIIIDDGSTDGTEEMIKSLSSPCPIKFLKQEPGKQGPACANNLGIKNAQGRYVLFMNSDIYVVPEFIEEHMKMHKQFKNIIVQGPAIPTDNFENPFQATSGYSGYSKIQLGYFITWNVSIAKELLFKAGLFDEDFRPYSWEDVELGYRLRKMKIKQKFNPQVLSFHYRTPFNLNDLAGIKEKSKIMGKNGVLFYRKHHSLEVMFATGAWWGMIWLNRLRVFLALRILGKERILKFYKWLFEKKKLRILAIVVGWAGKYWYMQAVEENLIGGHESRSRL